MDVGGREKGEYKTRSWLISLNIKSADYTGKQQVCIQTKLLTPVNRLINKDTLTTTS